MKKSIIVLISILLVMTFFSSCEQSIYEIKPLIVQNNTDFDVYGVYYSYYDNSSIATNLRDAIPDTVIAPQSSKEFALPYTKNGGRSNEYEIRVSSMQKGSSGVNKVILFTFNTASSDDIILTFEENPEEEGSDYIFTGEGSGFQQIVLTNIY